MTSQGAEHPPENNHVNLNLRLSDMRAAIGPSEVKAGMDTKAEASGKTQTAPTLFDQQWRLFEKRLDYGLKFFDHHAKQRMSMFQFFLIFVGFIFAGYGSLFKDGNFEVAAGLAILGAALSFCFIPLDRRNEELVHVAEDLLGSLERDVLFAEYEQKMAWPHRRGLWRMNKEEKTKLSGIFQRQIEEDADHKASKCRHGLWIPVFQVAIVMTFLILAGFAAWRLWKTASTPFANSAAPLERTAITVPVFVSVSSPPVPVVHGNTRGGKNSKKAQPRK